jgi:hypothetical protein
LQQELSKYRFAAVPLTVRPQPHGQMNCRFGLGV